MSDHFPQEPSRNGGSGSVGALSRIGMTVNVRTDQSLISDFDDMRVLIAELAAAGYGYIELGGYGLGLIIGGKVQRSRLAALRDALVDCPLRLTLHSSWSRSGRTGNLLDVNSAPEQRQGLAADLEVAEAIGAEVLVYHAGVVPNRNSDGDTLAAGIAMECRIIRELADDAAAGGIMIALENRAPTSAVLGGRSYGMRLDRVAEQVHRIDHSHVAMCLDVGHAYLSARYLQYDFLSAVREVAPLVGHIHFHDNFGRIPQGSTGDAYELEMLGEGDLHLPPGWGTIPLEDVLAVPYPQDPIVIVEIRHVRHYAEALATTRGLLSARVHS